MLGERRYFNGGVVEQHWGRTYKLDYGKAINHFARGRLNRQQYLPRGTPAFQPRNELGQLE